MQIQPLQQIILMTYLSYSIAATESIIVYKLFHWRKFHTEKRERSEALRRYKNRVSQWKHSQTCRRGRIRESSVPDPHLLVEDEDLNYSSVSQNDKGYVKKLLRCTNLFKPNVCCFE